MIGNTYTFLSLIHPCRDEVSVGTFFNQIIRKRKELLAELKTRGYTSFQDDAYDDEGASIKEVDSDDETSVSEEKMAGVDLSKGYEYLLGMKIWSLTFERAEELCSNGANKEVQKLQATTPEDIWISNLDAIELLLDEQDKAFGVEPKKQQFIQPKIIPSLPAKQGQKVVAVADEVSSEI